MGRYRAVNRDRTIDRLRGFVMLWVIFVHVIHWGDFSGGICYKLLKSLILFEMPLLFFLTGAANALSAERSYTDFVRRRFRRILIPYWIYAALCAVLSLVDYGRSGGIGIKTAAMLVLSWLLPVDRQMTAVAHLTQAVWFVPVYLCLVLFLPFFKRAKAAGRAPVCALLLGLCFALASLLGLDWLQTVSFYALWTLLGLFYPEISAGHEKYRRSFLCMAGLGGVLCCVLAVLGHPLSMQGNKFPPNVMFLGFSAVTMGVILRVLPCLDAVLARIEKGRLAGWLLDLYSRRSMTVFLYQALAFNLTLPLSHMLSPCGIVVKTLVCLLSSVAACAVLAVVFGRAEDLGSTKKRVANE